MSWREYLITIRVRGTVGRSTTATRRRYIYANSHEEAVTKAKALLVNAASYEVKAR